MKFLSCHLLASIVHLQLEADKKLDLSLITCFKCLYEVTVCCRVQSQYENSAESVLPASARLSIYSTAGSCSVTLAVHEIQTSLGKGYGGNIFLLHM